MPQHKKATFSLDLQVPEELDEAVAHGAAPSKNAFVQQALRHTLRKARREERDRRRTEAARDPAFMTDIEAVARDFGEADAESARSMP